MIFGFGVLVCLLSLFVRVYVFRGKVSGRRPKCSPSQVPCLRLAAPAPAPEVLPGTTKRTISQELLGVQQPFFGTICISVCLTLCNNLSVGR